MPIGTVAVPITTCFLEPRVRLYTLVMWPGLDRGVIRTSTFVANTTGFVQLPAFQSLVGRLRFAEANTSAGAPFWICFASASEPAKLYVGRLSIEGKASWSEVAPNTVSADAVDGTIARTASAPTAASMPVRFM